VGARGKEVFRFRWLIRSQIDGFWGIFGEKNLGYLLYMPLMERFFYFLGRILFPRQQDWQQTRSAKTFVFVVGFSLVLAFIIVKVIKMMYNHAR
jgi:hypothetical protein